MTPRAQELLDRLQAMRLRQAADDPAHQEISPRLRERIIVEKFDHEQGEVPVLVETVDVVFLNGSITERTVTSHVPPVDSPGEG